MRLFSLFLRKKAFFPPAKRTKFEEWLALQAWRGLEGLKRQMKEVHNDGSVVVHDFRPHQAKRFCSKIHEML